MNHQIAMAERFVALISKYSNWKIVTALPDDEMQTLMDLLRTAGHDPGSLVTGVLRVQYNDQDSWTGETYPINRVSPFKVMSQDKRDHYLMTGWLDCMFRMAALYLHKNKSGLIQALVIEIERSQPLQPIQLTLDQEFLIEYWPNLISSEYPYFVEHTRDNHRYRQNNLGIHAYCRGDMGHLQVSKLNAAAYCQKCHLRVIFPLSAKTYGEIRQAMAFKLAKL